MSIVIESGVSIPSQRKVNPNRITDGLKKLIERYADAYQLVYGVRPNVIWQNPWFKIAGVEQRVSRSRLLEMTRQLEYRAG